MFSIICAMASVLSDLAITDRSTPIKIELVVATNFELVWKDSIAALGQVHYCYGYMNAYDNVLKYFSFRDLVALSGLFIAFGWMSSVVNVFIEFSGTADLSSRLVNDVGRMAFVSACAVIALIFIRLAFVTMWAVSNATIFWMYVLGDGTSTISTMPHIPCIPTIGQFGERHA
jgi:hypothetical protein